MSGPGVSAQFAQLVHQAAPDGIQMDVPGQLQQIRVLFADDGLVPILKQTAVPLVPPIEIDHIPGEQPLQAPEKRPPARSHQEMEVVRHEGPRIDGQAPVLRQLREPIHEIRPVLVTPEDFGAVDAPTHDVVQRPGGIQSRLSEHACTLRPSA